MVPKCKRMKNVNSKGNSRIDRNVDDIRGYSSPQSFILTFYWGCTSIYR